MQLKCIKRTQNTLYLVCSELQPASLSKFWPWTIAAKKWCKNVTLWHLAFLEPSNPLCWGLSIRQAVALYTLSVQNMAESIVYIIFCHSFFILCFLCVVAAIFICSSLCLQKIFISYSLFSKEFNFFVFSFVVCVYLTFYMLSKVDLNI